MIRALYTAASGMSAQQMNLDTIANNLANSSTTGFRAAAPRVSGHGLPEPGDAGSGAEPVDGVCGAADRFGNQVGGDRSDHDAGIANQTSNPLDVAIEGPGFFQVQRPDGTIAYTRAGQFHLNNQGTIVTTDGDPLIPTHHHSA